MRKSRAEHDWNVPFSAGCDRAHANDYATFFGFFFPNPA
jgi:hypothetical protein